MALTDWRSLHGEHFDGCRVMVTGGAGFIGSHLSEALIELGAEVVVIDDLSGGDVANFATYRDAAGDRLQFVQGCILDRELLDQAMRGCAYVFHQAALGSVPRSIEVPGRYVDVNITGTCNVLEAARTSGVQRLMLASSSSIYGDSPVLPKVESMPLRPKSPYAASKAADEMLLRAHADCYELDTVSLRYFNIFGPRQNANSAYAAVIAAFAKALGEGTAPVIFGDGEQSRDFTFVENAVHANLLAARAQRPLGGEAINVACGDRITVNQLATAMANCYGQPDVQSVYQPPRAGDVRDSLADLALAEELLGYRPIVDFAQGLDATVQWYQEQAPAGSTTTAGQG